MTRARFILPAISTILFAAYSAPAALANEIDSGRIGEPKTTTSGICTPDKIAFRTESTQVNSASTVFVTMPNTSKPITTTVAGCVIVDFNGEIAVTPDGNRVTLRAVAAGTANVAEPPLMRMAIPTTAGVFQGASARFVFKRLPAGTYTIAIQWQGTVPTIYAQNRVLTIQYK